MSQPAVGVPPGADAAERGGATTQAARGAILATSEVALGFGAKTVLSGVTVLFPAGSVTAVIGPTGCGKSTLVRAFNRLDEAVPGYWRRGSIELDGTEVTDPRIDPLVLRRRVGMVFQRPNPLPLSIGENVLAGVRAHRLVGRRELPAVAERHLRTVGLWPAVADRLDDSPFLLSGGQQQLLCLARALAVEPEVLLLDEPTSSLDPGSTETVEQLLATLAGGLTIVLVTHNLAQARRVSDQTVFLYDGRLLEVGETRQLFEAPREPETVSYVSGRFG